MSVIFAETTWNHSVRQNDKRIARVKKIYKNKWTEKTPDRRGKCDSASKQQKRKGSDELTISSALLKTRVGEPGGGTRPSPTAVGRAASASVHAFRQTPDEHGGSQLTECQAHLTGRCFIVRKMLP